MLFSKNAVEMEIISELNEESVEVGFRIKTTKTNKMINTLFYPSSM